MEQNNSENGNSSNTDTTHADIENINDVAALRQMVVDGRTKYADVETKNRQLFERAKTAEGFEKQSDGSWVKVEKAKPGRPKKEDDSSPETEFSTLHRLVLKSEGVTEEDEVDLAKRIQKETNLDWEKLVTSKYFKAELEELRTQKRNAAATSNLKGSGGTQFSTKNDPAYWLAKGAPPNDQEAAGMDRKTLAKIARAFMNQDNSKKFYND